MAHRTSHWAVWAAIGLTGCFGPEPGDGGQIGDEANEGAHCEVSESTPLALDEASPGGFSAQEVLDGLEGVHEATLTYADGTTAALTVTVTATGDAAWEVQELVDEGTGGGMEPAISMTCPDVLSIGVTVGFATDDGVFAEQFDVDLQASGAGQASVYVPLEGLAGTFDVWDYVPDDGLTYDDAEAWLDLQWTGALAGTVHGQASGADPGDDPDGMAWATNFDIAGFGGGDTE
ncbi:MAG: hypothetical protein R3F59_05770 [Myxococcota bacterium]